MEGCKRDIAELLSSAGFALTITTDSNGLKLWNEAQGRHIQKGPDVLTFATSRKKLNFRTTFMPGPEVGRLQCIIAGELATIDGMDFSPEDWSALSDRLTMRNTARRDQMDIQPFVEAVSHWKKVSSAFQEEFKKSNDPLVVVRFLKEDPFALRAIWVTREVERWCHQGRYDLLGLVFSRGKGHCKDESDNQVKDFLLVLKVDKIVSKGSTKEQAFKNMTAFMGRHRSIDAVKKAYYRCTKQMYQKFFFETTDSYVFVVNK